MNDHFYPAADFTAEAAMFSRLQDLYREIDGMPDAHQRATVMIAACIEEGMNERKRILPAMEKLGFNRGHAAIILSKLACNSPEVDW